MNLLFLADCDWFTTIFDMQLIAEGMASRGHKVYAIDHKWPAQSMRVYPFYQQIEIPEISIFRNDGKVRILRPGFINGPPAVLLSTIILSHALAVAKAIKKWRIDAVIVYSSLVNGWQGVTWAKLFGVPVIVRTIDKHHILVQNKLHSWMIKRAEKYIFHRADVVLSNTPGYGQYAIEMGAKESKVQLVLFPLDTTLFKPQEKNLNLAHTLGIEKDDFVIVFMGTLFFFTGIVDVVRNVLPNILNEFPNTKFIIVGDGPNRKNVEEFVKALNIQNKVIITGYQPFRTMPEYINLADVCINAFPLNSKTKELFSGKLIQYLGCSKPVVTTALPGITSLIPEEETGVFYATNCNELSNKIINLFKDRELRESLGKAGREYTVTLFDYEKILDQFEEAIEEQVHKKTNGK